MYWWDSLLQPRISRWTGHTCQPSERPMVNSTTWLLTTLPPWKTEGWLSSSNRVSEMHSDFTVDCTAHVVLCAFFDVVPLPALALFCLDLAACCSYFIVVVYTHKVSTTDRTPRARLSEQARLWVFVASVLCYCGVCLLYYEHFLMWTPYDVNL